MTKRRKNSKNQTTDGQETAPSAIPNAGDTAKGPIIQTIHYCMSANCPGYPERASEDRPHPRDTCGSVVNYMHKYSATRDPSLIDADFDDTIELEPIDPPTKTDPVQDLPALVGSAVSTGFATDVLAATLEQPTNDTDPPVGELEHAPADVIDGSSEIRETIGEEKPQKPAQWQPPEPPSAPPIPDNFVILERADGLGPESDYIEVIETIGEKSGDPAALTKVVVYVRPTLECPDSAIFKYYTPFDFAGLPVAERVPAWVWTLRAKLLGSIPARPEPVRVEASTPTVEATEEPIPAVLGTPRAELPPADVAVEELPQPEASDFPEPAEDASAEFGRPRPGTYWRLGQDIVEILEQHLFDERIAEKLRTEGIDPLTAIEVVMYSTEEPISIFDSTHGELRYCYVSPEFWAKNCLLAESCPPSWILDERAYRLAKELVSKVDRLDGGAVTAQVSDADRPDSSEFSDRNDPIPHPLTAISEALRDLANEAGSTPSHVMSAALSFLQTFTQLLSCKATIDANPAVSAVVGRLTERAALPGSRASAMLQAAFEQVLGSVVDDRVMKATQGRFDGLERFIAAKVEKIERYVPTNEQLADLKREVIASVVGRVEQSFEHRLASKQEPAANDDYEELAKDFGKLEDRVFQLEGRLSEVRDYNRSVKLLKEDPKSSSQRGKEFRQREKEKAAERKKNLAELHRQNAEADAIHAGKPAKKAARGAVGFKANFAKVDAFMGKAKNDKVRSLLVRLPPSELPAFLDKCKRSLPNTAGFGWKAAELGAFAQWYYATAKQRR